MLCRKLMLWTVVLCCCASALAAIFGRMHGLVHDPQHRPVPGASVNVHARNGSWRGSVQTDNSGEFDLPSLPIGAYEVEVSAPGFAPQIQQVTLASDAVVNAHFSLKIAAAGTNVQVSETAAAVDVETSTTQTAISHEEIAATPGAERANSLAMITDYVPSAYMVHDQLHVRGGHQLEWMLDGVPVPNTNIASNVGPQFDPKDVDYLEMQRGGFSAESGDRAYGTMNVVTRSGFERNRQAELLASYGSFNHAEGQFNLGSHSDRFAYYGSFAGNRSDLGLETPTTAVVHDLDSGLSAFGSLIFNRTPNDQLRLVLSQRADHYQIPNTPEQQAANARDVENERDTFVDFSWMHTISRGGLLTVSPFFHSNRAHYISGASDQPISPEDDRKSSYGGGVISYALSRGHNNLRVGAEAFAEGESNLFGITDSTAGTALRQSISELGQFEAAYAEENFQVTSWLSLNGGVRFSHFSGGLSETYATPRAGASIRVPRLGWVLHGFYGRYYQPPPLATVAGPILDFAAQQGFGFLPLRGERDEQHEFGLSIPLRGWSLEGTNFRTTARNYFDHDVLGNSNIFFPLTIAGARIWGWEATAKSPQIGHHAQFHLAYSHQYAEGTGAVTGGLTDFSAPAAGYYFLDHDQRDTLSTGVRTTVLWRSWAAVDLSYGSGFLDGNGPAHLPPHTTVDLVVGRSFREAWTVEVGALNVGNNRFLLDNSNTFGGTHWANPREVYAQIKYRFHY